MQLICWFYRETVALKALERFSYRACNCAVLLSNSLHYMVISWLFWDNYVYEMSKNSLFCPNHYII